MSISSEITRIQNGVAAQSTLIQQIRTALINKTTMSISSISANSLSNNTTGLQTILSAVNSINEYPLTSYTISDLEAEENATRNGAVVTISGSTENSLHLTIDPTKNYVVAYDSVNCGFIGLLGDGSWSQLFDYDDEGENILLISGATYWYFYPLDYSEGSFELHNLNIIEVTADVSGGSGNYQVKSLALGASAPPAQITPDSGGVTYSITPVTLTWQHNTYVTISVDIAADGGLTVYKSSGGGTANNMVICYPQSDTYSAESEITAIPIPQSAGEHSIAITVWWDNQSGAHNDHNNHTLTYTVVSSGSGQSYDALSRVDVSIDTSVIKAENIAEGATILGITGTHSGGSITTEAITITSNGTVTAPSGKAYTPITVAIPTYDGTVQ